MIIKQLTRMTNSKTVFESLRCEMLIPKDDLETESLQLLHSKAHLVHVKHMF